MAEDHQKHAGRVTINLVGALRDIVENAKAHKAMALAGNPELSVLAGWMRACGVNYQRRMKYVEHLRANSSKWLKLLDHIGWTDAAVVKHEHEILDAARKLAAFEPHDADEVVAFCDSISASITQPSEAELILVHEAHGDATVWPELPPL